MLAKQYPSCLLRKYGELWPNVAGTNTNKKVGYIIVRRGKVRVCWAPLPVAGKHLPLALSFFFFATRAVPVWVH